MRAGHQDKPNESRSYGFARGELHVRLKNQVGPAQTQSGRARCLAKLALADASRGRVRVWARAWDAVFCGQ